MYAGVSWEWDMYAGVSWEWDVYAGGVLGMGHGNGTRQWIAVCPPLYSS